MEPWAGSRLIPLKFIEFAVLGTFGKLRLLHLLICLQLQRYDFSFTFRHIFEKYLMDSSEIICLRVQHYWFNLRVSVSSVWGSLFAPGVFRWWPNVGCPHWSRPWSCPLTVQLLPQFAVPLDDKRRMRGRQSGEREVLIVSYYLYSSILCSEVTKKG